MGKALEFDKSLFERLYTGPLYPAMSRTMLDVRVPRHTAQRHYSLYTHLDPISIF